MKKSDKIFVAGHRGLVGSAIKRELEVQGFTNILVKTHQELDLTDSAAVAEFFEKEKPQYVILAAAKVGGILGNNTYPVEFFTENMKIQLNVIENSFKNNVKKLLFLGSSCIYPKNASQPMKEEYLLSSKLEKTNEMYALAKISGLKLCSAYNREYGTDYISVMPCNLYGLNDNYDLKNAHVLPMLVRRFHEAKVNNQSEVVVWGTGMPKREFMYAGDLAKAVVFLLKNKSASEIGEFINIGTGEEITILELAELIKEVVGFKGRIVFDTSKPDGTMRKLMDVSRINKLGWHAQTSLKDGIKLVYEDFLNNRNIRL
ncbi:GDP-L-fucose synthase [Spirochaetes bacterium]|uniref:GDP-L-fucose synthase n=1 Tax=Candidatus Scatousia excrementipullorum TaxID=2840936 RepID=A0A9D9DQB1_9BACT|nr:GDP-L-fucose synthase [Candidatus Scatousia excrementipullorum]